MKIFGRIICAVKRKHLRGVLITIDSPLNLLPYRAFQCPRCHRETRYKVRQPLPATNGTSGEEAP